MAAAPKTVFECVVGFSDERGKTPKRYEPGKPVPERVIAAIPRLLEAGIVREVTGG